MGQLGLGFFSRFRQALPCQQGSQGGCRVCCAQPCGACAMAHGSARVRRLATRQPDRARPRVGALRAATLLSRVRSGRPVASCSGPAPVRPPRWPCGWPSPAARRPPRAIRQPATRWRTACRCGERSGRGSLRGSRVGVPAAQGRLSLTSPGMTFRWLGGRATLALRRTTVGWRACECSVHRHQVGCVQAARKKRQHGLVTEK